MGITMANKKVLKESDKKGYATDPDRINIKSYAIDKQKQPPAPKEPVKPAPSEIKKNQDRLTALTTKLGQQSQPSKPTPVKIDNVPTGGSDSDDTYKGPNYKKGGSVKSKIDGCAQRGKTRGKYC